MPTATPRTQMLHGSHGPPQSPSSCPPSGHASNLPSHCITRAAPDPSQTHRWAPSLPPPHLLISMALPQPMLSGLMSMAMPWTRGSSAALRSAQHRAGMESAEESKKARCWSGISPSSCRTEEERRGGVRNRCEEEYRQQNGGMQEWRPYLRVWPSRCRGGSSRLSQPLRHHYKQHHTLPTVTVSTVSVKASRPEVVPYD